MNKQIEQIKDMYEQVHKHELLQVRCEQFKEKYSEIVDYIYTQSKRLEKQDKDFSHESEFYQTAISEELENMIAYLQEIKRLVNIEYRKF